MSLKDLSDQRRSYNRDELTEEKISRDPYTQFTQWFEEAGKSGILEPNAMILSTATPDGRPSSRVVLLKAFDENGFIFYTNYHSRKGKEIASNGHASLLFFWDKLERQIRIEGTIEKVAIEVSDKYFSSRPFESRLSAVISDQSEEVPSRQYLEDKLEEARKQGSVARPGHWGGFRLKAGYFEFWQGRENRLHDRMVYEAEDGAWRIKRLSP